tara:strand:+ start:1834 stop:2019 length:186 start_codon:yes stop_codon:yes gene_type:complete
MTYKLAGKHASDGPPELAGTDIKRIIRKSDGAQIPFDPENTDYQEYLEWLKIDGNVPEEAD